MVENRYSDVSRAVLKKLTDQAVIAKVAIEFTDFDTSSAAVAMLTDESALVKVALSSKDVDIRRAAVARMDWKKRTNQWALAKVVRKPEEYEIREAALAKLTDQSILAKLAVEQDSREAIQKLTDKSLLSKVASESKDAYIRNAALEKLTDHPTEPAHPDRLTHAIGSIGNLYLAGYPSPFATVAKLTDQTKLAELALDAKTDWEVRCAAVAKLSDNSVLAKLACDPEKAVSHAARIRLDAGKCADQAVISRLATVYQIVDAPPHSYRGTDPTNQSDPTVLAMIAVEPGMDSHSRAIALMGIGNEVLLMALARSEPSVFVRNTAILLLEDESQVKQLASNELNPVVREAAVSALTDDDFLIRRASEDSSPTVRLAAVRALQHPEAVLSAATTGYYKAVRDAARQRLKNEGLTEETQTVLTAADQKFKENLDAIGAMQETDLVQRAISGDFEEMSRLAVSKIEGQEYLKRVALESKDRGVLKIAFGKVSDVATLTEIASKAEDPALRLAAAHKIGGQSWKEVFSVGVGDPVMMGNAIGAVSLYNTVQADAIEPVDKACLELIRLGDEARITEMTELLDDYGSIKLAEDYLNCGQPDLANAATAWGSKRGYYINKGSGARRAGWGTSQ